MLTKCANPSCSTPFIYLREGKVFMMEHHLRPTALEKSAAARPVARVEHFWLCGRCSTEMTIIRDGDGVTVVPKSQTQPTAA